MEPITTHQLQRQGRPGLIVLAALATVLLITPWPWQHQTCQPTTTTAGR
jgi:hypothetical protein